MRPFALNIRMSFVGSAPCAYPGRLRRNGSMAAVAPMLLKNLRRDARSFSVFIGKPPPR
jgi:hypothetical protein